MTQPITYSLDVTSNRMQVRLDTDMVYQHLTIRAVQHHQLTEAYNRLYVTINNHDVNRAITPSGTTLRSTRTIWMQPSLDTTTVYVNNDHVDVNLDKPFQTRVIDIVLQFSAAGEEPKDSVDISVDNPVSMELYFH